MKFNESLVILIFYMLSYSPALAQATKLSPTDEDAAFQTAGYKFIDEQWISDCYDPDMPSSSPGTIELVRDLNGDGSPEAVIIDSGTSCHGNTGVGFSIVSEQTNGVWKLILSKSGIPRLLETNGVHGWPDIEIGGPGFCHGVWQWEGTNYMYKCSHEEKPEGCSRNGVKSICK